MLDLDREAVLRRIGRLQVVMNSSLDDDDAELNVLGRRVDILGINCDQCVCMVQCCFTSTETIRLIGTGSQGRHLDFHTAPEL